MFEMIRDIERVGRRVGLLSFVLLVLGNLTGTVFAAAPKVISTYPANGATGVARGQAITITFDQDMDPASFDKLGLDAVYLPGSITVTYDAATRTATTTVIHPKAYYSYAQTLTVTVPYSYLRLAENEKIKNIYGEAMENVYTFSFTLEHNSDSPSVVSLKTETSTIPINGEIWIGFDEAVDINSINSSNIILSDGTTSVDLEFKAIGWVYDNRYSETIQITPLSPFMTPNMRYTLMVKKGILDAGGQATENDFSTDLITNSESIPVMTSTNPDQYGSSFPIDGDITVTFDQALSWNWLWFKIYTTDSACDPGDETDGEINSTTSLDDSGTIVTLTPSRDLVYGCYYRLNVYGEVYRAKDGYDIYFTTGEKFAHHAPTLSEWGMIFLMTAMIWVALRRQETFAVKTFQ
jgi:methionine-rich copper-binding protein CopC